MLKLKSFNFEQQQFQTYILEQSYPGQMAWIVGRNTNCDLVLPNPDVSRVHGRILYNDRCYYFVDIGSSSGTILNGEVLEVNDKQPLCPGDLLQIGDTFVHVESLAPPTFSAANGTNLPRLSFPDKQWEKADIICRCCRIIDETPDVKTFCFVAEPPVMFHYQPGQFVNLAVEIDGQTVMRPYSISSSPTRPAYLSITVKRVPSPPDQPNLPAGLVSNWLHDHLGEGDRVKLIGGALGHFTCLPDLPSKLLLISAGSGITPMMSMSRWIQDMLANSDVIFLHSARTPADIVFRSELEAMAAQMQNFRLAVTVTQRSPGQTWMGFTGRVSDNMLRLVAPDFQDRAIFVCGPNPFMQAVKSTLEKMHFPMQNYKEESFGGRKPASPPTTFQSPFNVQSSIPAAHPTKPGKSEVADALKAALTSAKAAPIAPGTVKFTQSNQSIAADPNSSILELAEQAGVAIAQGCRAGACGVCKVRTRGGKVHYPQPPAALSAADERAGYALACVGCPVEGLEVEA